VRSHLEQDLEFVEATLTSDDGWAEAVRGCRFVLHVASPFPSTIPREENDLIVPARDGALRVLRAASEAGVERVVLTSSIGAVFYGRARDHTFNETDWSNLESRKIGAYEKSKTIAERAAWQFMESLDENVAMELVVINPGLILGPLLTNEWSLSGETVKKMMDRDLPAIPDYQIVPIDVRDVALAHVRAMTVRGAAGRRFLCTIESHSLREIAQILSEEYGERGFKIPVRKLPKFLMPVAALFDKQARMIASQVGQPLDVDASQIKMVLGLSPRGLREMTIAMADSMIDYGVVSPTT
jgi:dihydroflavonol-4-reductase